MAARDMVSSREELQIDLERRILSGELAAGAVLPSERRLSEVFSVSRSGVRETLRVLAERGLVVVHPGKGAFVTDKNSGAAAAAIGNALRRENITARDVLVGRAIVEKEAAALAATMRTSDDLEAMEDNLGAFSRAQTILEMVKSDLGFHLALVRSSHNHVLEAMFRAISGFTAELMLRSLADRKVAEIGVPQHRAIFLAITAQDGDLARTLVEEHMAVAMTHYGDDLGRSLDAVAERELERLLGPTRTLADIWTIADARP